MPVRSLIEFNVRGGTEAAFKDAYLAHGFLSRAESAAGFLDGEFLQSDAEPSTFWATALWATHDDYAAWQANYLTLFGAETLQDLTQFLTNTPHGFALSVRATASKARASEETKHA